MNNLGAVQRLVSSISRVGWHSMFVDVQTLNFFFFADSQQVDRLKDVEQYEHDNERECGN